MHAEEIYPPYALKWNIFSSSKAYLQINGDGLDWRTSGYFSSIVSAWNCSYVLCQSTSFTYSKVDMTTVTTTWWNSNCSVFESIATAVTRITDTNNNVITSSSAAASSTKKIKYAMIAFSPNGQNYPSSPEEIRATMVHEIGHALCLGHVAYSSLNDSIMKQGYYNYETPRAYDHLVLSNKYS
ncbi:MAG: hypothetical protein IJM90_06925 [Firmicutes bacterium]|nr:hypothetical protein [Bacillota bacterium]